MICWMTGFMRRTWMLMVVLTASGLDAGGSGSGYEACPATCACLGNTVDCSKRKLTNIPDDLPSWTEVLDVSLNGITHLDSQLLRGVEKLQEINLNGNQLTTVNAHALRRASQLSVLKLAYNGIVRLPDLSPTPLVTHLILNHNAVDDIEFDVLRHATSLRVLDLAFNALTTVRNGSFPPLTALHHLYLNNNRIQSIDRGTFDNLTSLEWLKLSKNRLHSLSPAVFGRLSKLKYLDLNGNQLRRIEGLRFQGLANLISLRLRRNTLTELMDGAFWGLPQIQNLQLDYNNISRVHSGFLFGLETLEHLTLSHNRIGVVEADSWTACRRLSDLDLSYNRLMAITDATFAKLDSLQHLRLSHNRISYITEHAFRDLSALKVLDLDHNEVSGALDDTTGAFVGLSLLTRLSLSSNRIKSIGRHAFDGLHALKQLLLSNNDITSIQDNAFSSLHNLETVRLNSSSLLCDCQLSWLPTWLHSTGFDNDADVRCAHPVIARGQSILDVELNEFKCDDFPKPVIQKHPSSQIALKDGSLNLTCQAVTSSDTPLTIEWKKDHVILSNAQAETTARHRSEDEGGLYEVTSTLRLWPVKADHAGVYQCIASNTLGTAYSSRASVTISVFPRLVKTPSDLTIKAGTTARLECAATGQPTPEVAWQKDGGYDFPAARERRMHVMPSDDVFFIVDVKMEDQGVYTCTAKNDAGVVRANATLTVIQTPSFVKTTREKVMQEGDTVVFECLSSGQLQGAARTRVEWLKDGRPVPLASPRHYVVAESQILVVTRVQPNDAGVYTCIASNALGNERAVSRLTVIPTGNKVVEAVAKDAGASATDDTTIRIGLVVIAAVAGVVVTSLAWVVVIYCLQRRRDVSDAASSTSTDETVVTGSSNSDTLRYSSVVTKDGRSIVGGYRVSPVSWRFDTEDQHIGSGSQRLVPSPGGRFSCMTIPPSIEVSCHCKDSGCICEEIQQHEHGDFIPEKCCCGVDMQVAEQQHHSGNTGDSCVSLPHSGQQTPPCEEASDSGTVLHHSDNGAVTETAGSPDNDCTSPGYEACCDVMPRNSDCSYTEQHRFSTLPEEPPDWPPREEFDSHSLPSHLVRHYECSPELEPLRRS